MKILVAVNETKGSKNAVTRFVEMFSSCRPESVLLLYVEKFDASWLMDEMLGESELKALKEAVQGTEYKEMLDKKAEKILSYYSKFLEDNGMSGVRTMTKMGHPAEEILSTVEEEGIDMIVIGSRGKRFDPLLMGSVSREVLEKADIPVLVIKGQKF
ncbi:MAG TPA: universal stress protein [Nitrospirae bacterium]|nr:universal stress protein [Nitrospirota bacterium]